MAKNLMIVKRAILLSKLSIRAQAVLATITMDSVMGCLGTISPFSAEWAMPYHPLQYHKGVRFGVRPSKEIEARGRKAENLKGRMDKAIVHPISDERGYPFLIFSLG
jgi:hypothetical protein